MNMGVLDFPAEPLPAHLIEPDQTCLARGEQWLPRTFAFLSFVLQPERQMLWQGGNRVRIGGRALDLLTALVERPGELLSKDDLMAHVWPNIFVDEANLKVNMAGLRRVLGERVDSPRFIATVVGRGYRFIAPVRAHIPALAQVQTGAA